MCSSDNNVPLFSGGQWSETLYTEEDKWGQPLPSEVVCGRPAGQILRGLSSRGSQRRRRVNRRWCCEQMFPHGRHPNGQRDVCEASCRWGQYREATAAEDDPQKAGSDLCRFHPGRSEGWCSVSFLLTRSPTCAVGTAGSISPAHYPRKHSASTSTEFVNLWKPRAACQ